MLHLAGRRRFLAALWLLALAAFGVRTWFVLAKARHDVTHFSDAAYYELQADVVADGHGFVDPFAFLPNTHVKPLPAADHPPLTVLVLAPVAKLTDHDQLAMRFTFAVIGAISVVIIGLLAAEAAGETAGLVAAGIAAVYPGLWVNDGLIMSETLAVFTTTAALLVAYRLLRRPTWTRAALLGLLCGLAALARAELVLLVPLLAVGAALTLRTKAWRDRLRLAGVGLLTSVIVIGPWVGYNVSRFRDPVFISTNDGIALLGSNCDPVYYGGGIGLTNLGQCLGKDPRGDQSQRSTVYRKRAFHYMRQHLSRLPAVVLARAGRDWSLFRPRDMLSFNENEGRPRGITALGLWFYYPVLVLAMAGAVVLRRRRATLWPLLVAPFVVTVAVVLSYGQTRFRVPAESSIVVLAAVTITAAVSALRGKHATGTADTEVQTDATAAAVSPE